MIAKKALIVVTSTEKFPKVDKATGLWLGEAAHFYQKLSKEGWHIDFASPKGGYTPLDPLSLQTDMDEVDWKLYSDPVFRHKLANAHKPSDLISSHYDCIYFAGGHGSAFDFAENKELQIIAKQIYEKGGVVAGICHGVAALLNIKFSTGQYLLKGRNVTGYSNSEEKQLKLDKEVPFLIEDALKEKGAVYSKALIMKSNCVVDGRLITGQNNHSVDDVAKAVLQAKI